MKAGPRIGDIIELTQARTGKRRHSGRLNGRCKRERFWENAVPNNDAERLGERAKLARAIADKRKDDGTKQVLLALADNFERLAELAKEESKSR